VSPTSIVTPTEADWARAVETLGSASSSLLLAHVNPDADALGSALALGMALTSRGAKAVVSFGDEPFEIPEILQFLPGKSLVCSPTEVGLDRLDEFDVVVSLDSSSVDRLGVYREPLSEMTDSPRLLAVDHHTSYSGFGALSLVDATAPATVVLVLRLIDELGVSLTPEIAACLYAGLLTDTGAFRYAATTAATHEVAARLLTTGIAHDDIARELYDSAPFSYLQLLSDALGVAQLDESGAGGLGVAWTVVPVSMQESAGLGIESVEPVIDVLRSTRDAEVAFVVKEAAGGEWRVSARSRGRVDISDVCARFGGGGHRFAGGFVSTDDPDQTVEALRKELDSVPHLPE
jgi:bifunctional oligoribonuclease and PAP phosphatase NrnA